MISTWDQWGLGDIVSSEVEKVTTGMRSRWGGVGLGGERMRYVCVK